MEEGERKKEKGKKEVLARRRNAFAALQNKPRDLPKGKRGVGQKGRGGRGKKKRKNKNHLP